MHGADTSPSTTRPWGGGGGSATAMEKVSQEVAACLSQGNELRPRIAALELGLGHWIFKNKTKNRNSLKPKYKPACLLSARLLSPHTRGLVW